MVSEIISNYLNEQTLNGLSSGSIKTYKAILNTADQYKPLSKWDKKDVNTYFLEMQKTRKPATFEASKLRLKKFFNWQGSDICDHLKIKINTGGEIPAKEILTVEEVQLMIDTAPTPFYKALIAFLFESGARVNEVLTLNVSDFEETEKGLLGGAKETKIKDRIRPILCLMSAPYIRNLLNYSLKKPTDRLFDISPSMAWKALVQIGKDAGIKKKTNPHRLRHAQARQLMLEGYDPLISNKKLGWSENSNMRGRYSHACDEDVINATIEHAGGKAVKRTPQRLAEPETIPKFDSDRTLLKLNEENEQLKTFTQELQAQLNELKIDFQTAALHKPAAK